jgi:gluconolactonase
MNYASPKLNFITTLVMVILTACSSESSVIPAIEAQQELDFDQTPAGSSVAPISEIPALDQPLVEAVITPLGEASPFNYSQNLVPNPIAEGYQFTEGPATDEFGNVYFSDVNTGRIYKWSYDGSVILFIEGLNAPNGLAFDVTGNLIVCEGGNGRLISIDPQGIITVLADQYNDVRFNEPNDLWINSQGGIYFTDPAFNSPVVQEGEDVYYLSSDRSQVMRVIDYLIRPNGIVGSMDGKKLYVADWGAGQTYVYDINPDATLTNQQLFVASGSDGMTQDQAGNIYLTTPNRVQIYDQAGNLLREIPTPENPTNLTFAGVGGRTLFITARTAIYTVQFSFIDLAASEDSAQQTDTASFILASPDLVEGGTLPAEYTCDGASSTLALKWSGSPFGTQSYAVVMHHAASPDDVHWYWILFDIPANVTSLAKNSTGVGTLGNNSVNGKTEYAPPCSKGPGEKVYTYTIYALSAQPQFSVPVSQVSRDVLLEAIKDITLGNAELHVTYSRK